MRKWVILCVVFLLLLPAVAFADDGGTFVDPEYSSEFIAEQERMLADFEQLFPRPLLHVTFDGTEKPTVTKFENRYNLAEANRSNRHEIMLSAVGTAEKEITRGLSFFETTGSYENFYVRVDAQLLEQDDSDGAFIWFEYTNANIVGENNGKCVSLDYPRGIHKYEYDRGVREETLLFDFSDLGNDYKFHKFEMFRLNGSTSFFIDGSFVANIEDGFSGRFYTSFGCGLSIGGKYATAVFDDYVMRVR